VDEWLSRLGTDLGVGPLPLSRTGACSVELESGLHLGVEPGPDGRALFLYAALGPVPKEADALITTAADLLSRNDLAEREGPGSFAIDPRRDTVVLWASTELEGVTDYPSFLAFARAFVAKAEEARSQFDAIASAPADQLGEQMQDWRDPLLVHARFVRA
jgi:hypothetical protein